MGGGAGPLLKKAGRKFVRNLLWMLALFGTLGALFWPSQRSSAAAGGGGCGWHLRVRRCGASDGVVALWDGTTTTTTTMPDEARLSGHNYPGARPDGSSSGSGGWHGGRGDGDGVGGGDGQ